jgi:8-oxo-dGTP pyrophosphatase MutT (NUDIX family)
MLPVKDRSKLPFRKNCEGYFFSKDENVLAKERNGFIFFPGGGIEAGEDPRQAVIREAFEETGAILTNVRKVKELKFVWWPDWAKTGKQKVRYEQFQGEDMHFFVGEVSKLEEPFEKEEDFWEGERLMPVVKAIRIIESGRPFTGDTRKYRTVQLEFLRKHLKNKKGH